MPKYICFFSYTREAGKAMIEKPTDRVAAAKALVESVGGKMECFYWMHGHHDGFFIEVPRSLVGDRPSVYFPPPNQFIKPADLFVDGAALIPEPGCVALLGAVILLGMRIR